MIRPTRPVNITWVLCIAMLPCACAITVSVRALPDQNGLAYGTINVLELRSQFAVQERCVDNTVQHGPGLSCKRAVLSTIMCRGHTT
jgi:hypothetical protein